MSTQEATIWRSYQCTTGKHLTCPGGLGPHGWVCQCSCHHVTVAGASERQKSASRQLTQVEENAFVTKYKRQQMSPETRCYAGEPTLAEVPVRDWTWCPICAAGVIVGDLCALQRERECMIAGK